MERSLTILSKLNKHLVANYEPQLIADHGSGAWLWDVDGNKYFDFLGSYAVLNIGHCHPRIIAAIKKQLDKLGLVSRTTPTEALALFSEKLVHFCGFGETGKILPALGGHEAVEKAIKIARKWGYETKGIDEKKAEIISCIGSFHGRTYGALSLMTNQQYKYNFGPFLPGFIQIPFGDIGALEQAITKNTAAFIVEPIQGEGGVIVPPSRYLPLVSEICRENGVLFIADEIQTGFGRTGHNLSCERVKVQPDIFIVGKGFSGGVEPVSAVVGRAEIMDVIKKGDDGSTFAGNPLSCVAALEAMKILEEEELSDNAYDLGLILKQGLRNISRRYIKEVRGRGLMIGVELVENVKTENLIRKFMAEGILLGASHNVLRFNPPLNIGREDIYWALPKIKKVLES